MALRSMKPCNKLGCPNLTRDKYCEEHIALEKKEYRPDPNKDKGRPSAAARGYDAKWRAYREDYLRVNTTCKSCGAKATVIDHVIPHKGNKGLFWTRFNHQPLCKPCHDRKTATQDGGFGRK
jgi:5-methylcytosine-specific restriction protein A